MTPAERMFDAGWRMAARWANRDDLLADVDSPEYRLQRARAIEEARPAFHVACQSGAVIREEGE